MTPEQARAQARGERPVWGEPSDDLHPEDCRRVRSGQSPLPRNADGSLTKSGRVMQQMDVWAEMVSQLSDASLHALLITVRAHYRRKGLVMSTSWKLVHESLEDQLEGLKAKKADLEAERDAVNRELEESEGKDDHMVNHVPTTSEPT